MVLLLLLLSVSSINTAAKDGGRLGCGRCGGNEQSLSLITLTANRLEVEISYTPPPPSIDFIYLLHLFVTLHPIGLVMVIICAIVALAVIF